MIPRLDQADWWRWNVHRPRLGLLRHFRGGGQNRAASVPRLVEGWRGSVARITIAWDLPNDTNDGTLQFLTIDPTGTRLFVANGGTNNLTMFDITSGAPTNGTNVALPAGASQPSALAVR